jgi:hypothetical protein
MSKLINNLPLAILIPLVLAACTPVRVVSTETAPMAEFSQYKTFGFYEDEKGLEENPNFLSVKRAVSEELSQRGLTQADSPDLLINIAGDREEKVQTRETDIRDAPVYMGTRNYSWESEEIVVREYTEGTVKIDVVDAATNQMVWQGIAAGTITGDQTKMDKRIKEAMDKLFERFPVKE